MTSKTLTNMNTNDNIQLICSLEIAIIYIPCLRYDVCSIHYSRLHNNNNNNNNDDDDDDDSDNDDNNDNDINNDNDNRYNDNYILVMMESLYLYVLLHFAIAGLVPEQACEVEEEEEDDQCVSYSRCSAALIWFGTIWRHE